MVLPAAAPAFSSPRPRYSLAPPYQAQVTSVLRGHIHTLVASAGHPHGVNLLSLCMHPNTVEGKGAVVSMRLGLWDKLEKVTEIDIP